MSRVTYKFQDHEGTTHEAVSGRHTSKCGRWVVELLPTTDSSHTDCIACPTADDSARPISASDMPNLQQIPRRR